MWHVKEVGVTLAPSQVEAVYFIWMSETNTVIHSSELALYVTPTLFAGDIPSWVRSLPINTPVIPIDLHLALTLSWITIDQAVDNMPYVTDTLKACVRLVKGAKEHGEEAN